MSGQYAGPSTPVPQPPKHRRSFSGIRHSLSGVSSSPSLSQINNSRPSLNLVITPARPSMSGEDRDKVFQTPFRPAPATISNGNISASKTLPIGIRTLRSRFSFGGSAVAPAPRSVSSPIAMGANPPSGGGGGIMSKLPFASLSRASSKLKTPSTPSVHSDNGSLDPNKPQLWPSRTNLSGNGSSLSSHTERDASDNTSPVLQITSANSPNPSPWAFNNDQVLPPVSPSLSQPTTPNLPSIPIFPLPQIYTLPPWVAASHDLPSYNLILDHPPEQLQATIQVLSGVRQAQQCKYLHRWTQISSSLAMFLWRGDRRHLIAGL